MYAYFKEICIGTWSLLVGLSITLKYFFQPVVTVQYPHAVLPMTPRFRGHIELLRDENTLGHKCIVCMSCQKACPSGCIAVAGKKLEGSKKTTLTGYTLNFTTCSLCGLCVESCPTNALVFSKEFNLAGTAREAYVYDLVKRLEEKHS